MNESVSCDDIVETREWVRHCETIGKGGNWLCFVFYIDRALERQLWNTGEKCRPFKSTFRGDYDVWQYPTKGRRKGDTVVVVYNHCSRQTTEKLVAKQKTRRGVSVQGLWLFIGNWRQYNDLLFLPEKRMTWTYFATVAIKDCWLHNTPQGNVCIQKVTKLTSVPRVTFSEYVLQ